MQGIQTYTPTIKKAKDKERDPSTQKAQKPYNDPNQSIKFTKVWGHSTINSFASDQREHKKEYFNFCIDILSSLKANRFLAFHTIQKIWRGAALLTFLCFLPTEEICQLSRVSLTEHGNTQDTPNKEKSNSHKTLIFEQWRSRWFMVSSFSIHMKHLFANDHPLF